MNQPRYYVVSRESLGRLGHESGESRESAEECYRAAADSGEEVVVLVAWEATVLVRLPTVEEVMNA